LSIECSLLQNVTYDPSRKITFELLSNVGKVLPGQLTQQMNNLPARRVDLRRQTAPTSR
jgi:hypothetical protein